MVSVGDIFGALKGSKNEGVKPGSGSGGGMGGGGFNGKQLLMMVGPMIDNSIVAVPLEKFKEIKEKNPESKVVPLMRDDEIKFDETRFLLKMVSKIVEDIPVEYRTKELKNGAFKLGFGLAYKMDNDAGTREKLMSYLSAIIDIKNVVDSRERDKYKNDGIVREGVGGAVVENVGK